MAHALSGIVAIAASATMADRSQSRLYLGKVEKINEIILNIFFF